MDKISIAILQPSYIPWIGYFDQIDKVDKFVFYDDVLYTKNDWRNRNKIKADNKAIWLTVPICSKSNQKINDVKPDSGKNWQKKHLKTLIQYYKKSRYFNEIYNIVEKNIFLEKLVDININIIKDICDYIGTRTTFYISSKLQIGGNRNERLINICNFFKAKKYITGYAAKSYLDIELFQRADIEVKFQQYKHPIYEQLGHNNFIPYLSILDLLFNYGKDSLKIIKSGTNYV